MEIDVFAVERGLVDLEVPGVHHDAARRPDGKRDAVRHAVRHPQELDRKRSDRDALPRLHPDQPGPGLLVRLIEPLLNERQGESRPVHRPFDVGQHVGHGADVVLVAVCQHEGGDGERFQWTEIRDDQVDPQQLRLWKAHAGIDKDRGLPAGDDHHVHPELANPAEGDDLERGLRGGRRICSNHVWAAVLVGIRLERVHRK